jgi:hypothetical protein
MTVLEILEAALKLEPDERELQVEELSASLNRGFASEDLERAYRYDDAQVIIVAIAHRKRRPGYWSRR